MIRFASSLNPERDDHFWFLICEFICYAQYKIIDDGPSTENLHVLRVFANKLTIDRFRALKRNDMNFVFDSLFQCLFYKYENNNGDWLSLSGHILVDIDSDAMKFTDLSHIDRILQILLTSKVQMVFQSYMQSEPYEEFANKLINSCYLYLLPKEVNGKTLYNSSIILNSINHFEEEKEIIGFIAVVFLHEMGHVAVRSSFKTALQSLEFNSEEDIELSNNSSQSSNEEKESGYRVEEIIFGKKLKKLNSLAAEYLGDSKNWNSEDFQIKFKELNSMKIDSEGKKIKFVRMKKGNDVGFLNLDYNWCGTTRLRNIS